ncbi:MAG: M50 family metallopeptidase [Verrucomicrobia bacterium]|nr:M50 family metallopeptidase [Verrucomicrobiota bacterium]
MTPTRQGSIRLLRIAGIDLFLHWSWFIVAFLEIKWRAGNYSSIIWNVLEYLSLFFIVMLHEFGHALACRQVGGTANQIVLWPLGGVAYVSPPQRPGPMLWSIAAGPLVNVVLFPIFGGLVLLAQFLGWPEELRDAYRLIVSVWGLNGLLLIFNLLPVYPLDGGQILRSLLWFVVGRARSLMAAAIVGFVGVAAMIGLALWIRDPWLVVMSVFILVNCWGGLMQARALARMARLPRLAGFACPSCHTGPPAGELWVCGQCRARFNTFAALGVCPQCGEQFPITQCFDCGASHPMPDWVQAPPPWPGA